jgi:hypothetical protein
LYLLVHAREPLRLNMGDPWTDASVMVAVDYAQHRGFGAEPVVVPNGAFEAFHPTHAPPFADIVYEAVGVAFGIDDIAALRLIALAFSAIALLALFHYVRRMWSDTVAVIATALFATSLAWMTFADSVHRPPIMHAACFVALWGVVRALETGRARYYAVVFAASFMCLFTAYDNWLFLPAAVLFTLRTKRGDVLARDNWLLLAIVTVAGIAAVLALRPFAAEPLGWQASLDHASYPLGTVARRLTVLFTPMVWITLILTVWRGLRAPSVRAVLDDGMTWMFVVAIASAWFISPRPESATLRAQLWLPFYAIGSAIILEQVLRVRPRVAPAWCVLAPLWTFYLAWSHPREVLDRGDVAKVNDYLARTDRNDFVLSNLLADGPIQAAFGRHAWPALDDSDPIAIHLRMLSLFEMTGTDRIHAIIFTTTASRNVDRSLVQLIAPRRLPSVHGWPQLVRGKVDRIIKAYDRSVLANLAAVGARKVMSLANFDVYELDRSATIAAVSQSVPSVHEIDLGSMSSTPHKLLGWGEPWLRPFREGHIATSSIDGYATCENPVLDPPASGPAPNRCMVISTRSGLRVVDVGHRNRAELMVRTSPACDLQLTLSFASPAAVEVSFNDATVLSFGDPGWGSSWATIRVPRESVRDGINVLAIEDDRGEPRMFALDLRSVTVAPMCEPRPSP